MASNVLTIASSPAVSIPTAAFSHRGFRAWALSDDFPRQGRISFISDRVLVDMSPEELVNHNHVKSAVSSRIFQLVEERNIGRFFGDGTLVSHEAAELSTEPDASFVTWDAFKTGRVRAVPRAERPDEYIELEGSPDWVLEVVSLSSRKKDTQLLRTGYHAAGVPEYWLIDAMGGRIDFKLLVWRKSGYVARRPIDGWVRSTVFGCEFQLKRRRDPLGMWRYALHVRG